MKKNRIFISIASYRDKNCNLTIKSIYDNAKFPENIFIGICQQNKNTDLDSLYDIDNNNIKIIRIDYTEAKGPVYARYLASTLWDNEEYYLQIDSHTIFIKNWDIICINSIKNLKKISEKPVLSHYPRDYPNKDIKNKDKFYVTYVRYLKFIKNKKFKIIQYEGARFIDTKNTFIRTPFVTGNFLFLESTFLKEIPYDNTLDYLHHGEEILHSLRFYTYGYDIFIPNQNIIYHNYLHKEPKIWNDIEDIHTKRINAHTKIVNVFKSKTNSSANKLLGTYNLGKKRSIKNFKKFSNIYNELEDVSFTYIAIIILILLIYIFIYLFYY